jgi:3-oxoadipate enol-lactonase
MPVATVNDVELNYLLEGDGEETIVLVNGLADSLETWVLQMDDFLAAGFRVLRFDNRGVGASSKPAGPYSSRLLADDTKALADSLGITGFHLMGVSMGGMIAVHGTAGARLSGPARRDPAARHDRSPARHHHTGPRHGG